MKKYNPLYYLLFILLVMGAFASMAQNSYGLKIIGGVAFSFTILFLIQLVSAIKQKNKQDILTIAELVALLFLSAIMGLRVFYIHFPYVELLFTAAGILLMLVYLKKMIFHFKHFRSKNRLLAIYISIFHLSLILFLVSLVLVSFAPAVVSITGIIAFVLLMGFIAAGFLKKEFMVEGENVSAFSIVRYFKDHSIVILSLFLLLSLYTGFNKIGMVPGIYSDEFPQAYYELVDQAASRKEKAVKGRYKHMEFKDNYEMFLKHNNTKNQ